MSISHNDPSVVSCLGCGQHNRVPPVAGGVPRCASCHAPLPWSVDADDSTFATFIAGRLPVLVDVWAPWCGPCRTVAPVIEEVTRHFAGRLKTVKVNVDDAPVTARQLGVQGVPTLLVIKDGEVIASQVGAMAGPALGRWIAKHLEETAA